MNRKWMIAVIAGLTLTGCAAVQRTTGIGAPSIDDSWVARVPQSEMQSIDEARADLRMARDELARLEADLEDAENRAEVADSRLDAAEDTVDAEETRLEAARIRNDQEAVEEARIALDEARMKHEVAQAQAKLRSAQEELADEKVDLAEQQVELAEAELEHQKFLALRKIDDPRVADMDEDRFSEAVSAQRADVRGAERDLTEAETLVSQREQSYDQAQQRMKAALEGTPKG